MNAKRLAVATALSLVPSVAMAIAYDDVRRVTPANRPYIVEIGEPQPLGPRALQRETRHNTDLREYLDFYGWPDYAEIQEIEPNFPWDAYEVRLYYLKRDREIAFGGAFIAPQVSDLGLIKYQGRMDPGTRDRIVALVTPPPSTASEEPERVEFKPVTAAAPATAQPDEIEMMVRRIEAAAERASAAADNAAEASEAANASADRTVNILGKLAR
ncbi:MAG TPA: hypothetical protein VL403_01500 [Candidatus Kryptonia bacterium]|nr:hypothetical protein [Candidatus Kryptonia bacterium]